MNRTAITAALMSAVIALPCPSHAQQPPQQIGQACPADVNNVRTVRSVIEGEGIIQCIPDANGNFYWQPMGGIARYDSTPSCSIAGAIRWNGSAIQYCDGANWNGLGTSGGVVGKLYWSGKWTQNVYWCDTGYHLVAFHYDCYCTNNADWFECQASPSPAWLSQYRRPGDGPQHHYGRPRTRFPD